ncbi:MAG: hypothetical protein KF912_08600 [Phycisphaeraceae bacterium]|nr:hypothetical protein [Phycisphaeraceae bacterium]MBX3367358.1 hypothetical protein [Phycisphaeraceae bacterium]
MTTDRPSDHDPMVLPFGVSCDEDPGVGRRLVVGFVLCCVLVGICWVVLPRFGVWVPAWIPLAGFVLIVIATVAASRPRDDSDDINRGGGCDDGRPICCSGPRPLKMFKE